MEGAMTETFDAVVVGGGPAGATAAADLARNGRSVLLLDRAGRIKPCGGAIPPVCVREFGIPDSQIVARATGARIVSPTAKEADMPITGGYVGMVDREGFDEYLRERAGTEGATRRTGTFERIGRDPDGVAVVHYATPDGPGQVRARAVIGADGAKSNVAKQCVKGWERVRYVFAYHEIVRAPKDPAAFDANRCDVYYQGTLSPDFYAWIFPHGDTMSIGTGSAKKGWRRSGGKVRRSRCARCAGGTTGATWCWPGTPRVWWRRHPAKASTTPCSADGWQPRPWRRCTRPATCGASSWRASGS